MEHKGTVLLETERLILRRFEERDAQAMFDNWASNPNVTQYLTWQAHGSVDDTKALLREWVKNYGCDNFYQWAIELKTLAQPIGSISVVRIQEEVDECEVGYCLGEEWWKKGIMTEAFKRVIAFLFEEVKANRICADHDTENVNSGKVMQKSGLTYEGTLRQAGRNSKNPRCDLAVYAVIKALRKERTGLGNVYKRFRGFH